MDNDPIVWLNMVGSWLRTSQFDEDAALVALDKAKSGVVELESRISALQQSHGRLLEALSEINQYLKDVVETHRNGDSNNWNGYYLPLFKQLSEKYDAATAEAPPEAGRG